MVDETSSWRHNVRGCLNSLKLCTSVFDGHVTPDEAMEFLKSIDVAADRMVRLMEQGERLPLAQPDRPASPAAPPATQAQTATRAVARWAEDQPCQ